MPSLIGTTITKGTDMAVTKTITLVYSEITESAAGHNKVWIGELHDDDSVITKWGRVGYDMQSKTFPGAGESFLLKKEKEKLKKGYTVAKTLGAIEGSSAGNTVKVDNLGAIAQKQLSKNNPELAKLIDRLVRANIHNITSQTNITYNSSTGLFQTPLGIVTREGIDDARNLLVEIKKGLVAKKQSELVKLVSGYLRIIPQNVGYKLKVESVFPDLDSVEKQSDILDSLEASLASVTSAPQKTDDKPVVEEKVFEVDLDVLPRNNEYDRLVNHYNRTKHAHHGYNHIQIAQIYTVTLEAMQKAFDKGLTPLQEVYHGTSQANLLSIFKSGIKTSPPSTAYIAGKMFGNGIYGAVESSKSLGYTFGKWGGSRAESGWLFVCDFAMGKIHEPHGSCSRPASGCDSVWARAKNCGLYHDELIVYANRQVNIKYLMECK
jgi:poly [ADP-ribose] polymerase